VVHPRSNRQNNLFVSDGCEAIEAIARQLILSATYQP